MFAKLCMKLRPTWTEYMGWDVPMAVAVFGYVPALDDGLASAYVKGQIGAR